MSKFLIFLSPFLSFSASAFTTPAFSGKLNNLTDVPNDKIQIVYNLVCAETVAGDFQRPIQTEECGKNSIIVKVDKKGNFKGTLTCKDSFTFG